MKLSGIEEGHNVHVLVQKKFSQGCQDQVGEQLVPLLGLGDALETSIWLVGIIGHEKTNGGVAKVARTRLVDHKYLFEAMGMPQRTEILFIACRGNWPLENQ